MRFSDQDALPGPLSWQVAESAAAEALLQAVPSPAVASSANTRRLRELFERHYDFVWRSLRRLGVRPDAVDDAAQEVFVVAARKIEAIAFGAERSFLYGTSLRVASDARRAESRRRESSGDSAIERAMDPTIDLEAESDRQRARALLDQVLSSMSIEHRAVFTLFELEGMTMAEIASFLELAPGTVASRLRRARELFQEAVTRIQARNVREGARP